MNLQQNIKRLRKSQGLTQAEFGEKLGIDQKVITSYERGIAKPPLERLIQMSELFKVTLDELVGANFYVQEEVVLKKSTREGKLLEAFQDLTPAQQRVVVQQAEGLKLSNQVKQKN